MNRLWRHALILMLTTATAACGYALAGRGNSLPGNVRIIGVPAFENQSGHPGVEQAITDAIRAEFAGRGSLRVLPEAAGSDAVLTGVILEVRSDPTAFDEARQATRYAVVVAASIELRETDGNVLWSDPRQQFREEYDVGSVAEASDPTALFRQDTNALERLSQAVARSIVTSILEAF